MISQTTFSSKTKLIGKIPPIRKHGLGYLKLAFAANKGKKGWYSLLTPETLRLAKAASFRKNLDLIFQYDGKKVMKIRSKLQNFGKVKGKTPSLQKNENKVWLFELH